MRTIAADIYRALTLVGSLASLDHLRALPYDVVNVLFPFDSWGNVGSRSSNLFQVTEREERGAGM